MKRKLKQPKNRNPMFIRKATMTINDKREKVAKRRHEHEMFQAKLLRKELKYEDRSVSYTHLTLPTKRIV